MAKVLKLQKGTGLLQVVDLQGGSSGYQLQRGWQPKIATMRAGHPPARVTEQIPLAVRGSSQDNLAELLQDLHEIQVGAVEYIGDRMAEDQVWLHRQMENETGEARALVREIPAGFQSGWYDPFSVNNKGRVILPIVREGSWERPTAVETAGAVAPAAAAVVVYDYPVGGSVPGDVPSRIKRFRLSSFVSGVTISRIWAGFRSANKHGTLANFEPIWEFEDGTLGTNAAFAADATASPGGGGNTKIVVTPGTATWAKRASIVAGDVISGGQEGENWGRFLRLLRYQVSAGTWEVQFRVGYSEMSDDEMIQGPIKEVTSTTWDYVDMGIFDYPLRDLHVFPRTVVGVTSETNYEIQVWGRRTAGAGNLQLDCTIPMPVDEGSITCSGFNLLGRTLPAPSDWLYIGEAPEGRMQVLMYNPNTISFGSTAIFSADNFRPPVGDGRMIVVYARESSSVLTDRIQFEELDYYPRWLSLRGAE